MPEAKESYYDINKELTESRQFSHPYKPYGIQLDFMKTLYSTLESKKVGIFESPTGTGKTLSLICGSMSWLRDHNRGEFEKFLDELNKDDNDNEPAWVREHTRKIKEDEMLERIKAFEEKLERVREKERKASRMSAINGQPRRVKRQNIVVENEKPDDDDFYLLKDDDENLKLALDPATSALLASLDDPIPDNDLAPPKEKVRIYFASRTHSQLSQFVGQLRLPEFPPSVNSKLVPREPTKEVSLSSRKHLCIHSKVSKYTTVSQMNDACHDMAKKSTTRCKFHLNMHELKDQVLQQEFQNKTLAEIKDIEDLADLGRELQVCPYYATREVADWCDVIALPYQLLLQKEARESLNISLENSIVVIDEAHNLLDVISSLHSISITHTEIKRSLLGLQTYYNKFSKRLGRNNLVNLSKLIQAVKALENFMTRSLEKPRNQIAAGKEIELSEFFSKSHSLDMINSFEMEKFIKKTKLVFKIESYLDKLAVEEKKSSSNLVLSKTMSFLSALGNPSWEGKFSYSWSSDKTFQLEYILLDPSFPFKEIITKARCTILAGGTMKPMDDYLNYLFPYLEQSQITQFSCDHIIPDENLVVLPIAESAAGQKFSFTFAERNSKPMIKELGLTILSMIKKIPHGVVIFFPSYSYMNSVVQIWQSQFTPRGHSIYEEINSLKKVFSEPQTASISVEEVLDQFGTEIQTCKDANDPTHTGAILFSVVSGKMSEGINFSDDLARGVIMIGLPFPNAFSAEMVAKREYVENKVLEAGGTRDEARAKARDFYENICMRAVNQCVGRAVRHALDYSSIILIDARYQNKPIQGKLSFWVQKRIHQVVSVENANDILKQFFVTKK
jgi:chromosome transmission fidelity protein 1